MPIQKTTVEAIIKTSAQVFRQQGYYRTSMADLANATGLTKGVFYHHFKNKEEIMQKVLEMSGQYFEHKIFSIAYESQIEPQTRLNRMFKEAFVAFTHESGGCLFANTVLETAHLESTFLPFLKAFFKQWEKALCFIFSSKHDKKTCTKIARQIIADVEGSLLLMQLYKDPDFLKQALKRAKGLL